MASPSFAREILHPYSSATTLPCSHFQAASRPNCIPLVALPAKPRKGARTSLQSEFVPPLPEGFQHGLITKAQERMARVHPHRQPPVRITCRRYKDRDRDREALPYIVTVITPPPRQLGTHKLAPNMQCGETVEVSGEPFIISSVTYRYQLRRGRYEPAEKRLDVQTTGRYLVNLFLGDLLEKS
eukprot:TRINITY_DN23679_c0_g1_i1.p1 TRINITY_DN23679_c0_g1~~TRINITY_DN23679_c0_g1_i1.p1  ORF type:complete len:184 (-),score=1.74 TRINITY_DN23679_c0_g1_i1:746-1297(-)